MDRAAEAELDVSLRELAEDAAMTLTSRARQALLCDAPQAGPLAGLTPTATRHRLDI